MKSGVRRIVTGHDSAGKAVIRFDDTMEANEDRAPVARFFKLWTTSSSPADNNDEYDGSNRETGLTSPGGTVLRIVDIYPGQRSPMHRTLSLDYGIVLDGKVDMELDSGEVAHLRTGDVVVQRGTIHAWVNNYEEPVRMAFVLIDATPATVGGKALGPV